MFYVLNEQFAKNAVHMNIVRFNKNQELIWEKSADLGAIRVESSRDPWLPVVVNPLESVRDGKTNPNLANSVTELGFAVPFPLTAPQIRSDVHIDLEERANDLASSPRITREIDRTRKRIALLVRADTSVVYARRTHPVREHGLNAHTCAAFSFSQNDSRPAEI